MHEALLLCLGVQGRARPTLARLYNWRYRDLQDLPHVITSPEYLRGNPGFAYDYQFIDVPDLDNRGESEPIPYFYQVQQFAFQQSLIFWAACLFHTNRAAERKQL